LVGIARPRNADEVQMHLLIPSFMISELRTAFEMGFILYMPFLLIDLVVASILMAMGMVMVPPAMIGLPIKIMLFVLADGWNVLVHSLVRSFG
ncbi:MAG: flagellar biosynthetic protein FliP, partial [Deltaproteobacteria bacterium]